MVILVFILLILIGFLLFSPLKVDYDIATGQKKSSMPAFAIYCLACMGLTLYFTLGSINFSEIIGNQNNEDNKEVIMPQETTPEELPQPPKTTKNSINFNSVPNAARHIVPIRELVEYDGMTKKELFARRKTIVDSFSGLGGENYQPDEKILGNIQDGKPWWGTEGILCKGQGSHASDGKSRESSYFENPMILLNLELTMLMNGNPGKEDCAGLWPLPTSVIVYPETKTIEVSYDLSGFMKEFEGSKFYERVKVDDWFGFGNINARDFGYEYAQAYETKGIRFANTPNASTVSPLVNYWCLGHSCKVEGGCNNICPANSAFTFFVDEYPAYAKFKLYKSQPQQGTEPDAYVEVYLN